MANSLLTSALAYTVDSAPGADFNRYPVDRLIDNSSTDFDLFIRLSEHFILYSGNGYRWDRQELTELLSQGHSHFYIRNTDLAKAKMYERINRVPKIDFGKPPSERIVSIEQVGAKFIECLYEGDITESCIKKAELIGEALVDCVSEDSACIKAISGLANYDYYTYYHSMRVATYSVAISIELGLRDVQKLRQIALGGIFHDVGKKAVPMEILNKQGPLNESEWTLMKSHPENGFQQVGVILESYVPREIILHHHEKRNGTGYPHGLDKNSLIYEVQIATLADIFDALTSSRSYQRTRSRYEALDFIKHKLLGEEVCPDAFRALINCLAK